MGLLLIEDFELFLGDFGPDSFRLLVDADEIGCSFFSLN
jgi:hypothetical protein